MKLKSPALKAGVNNELRHECKRGRKPFLESPCRFNFVLPALEMREMLQFVKRAKEQGKFYSLSEIFRQGGRLFLAEQSKWLKRQKVKFKIKLKKKHENTKIREDD